VFINNVVSRGVAGTAMQGFAGAMPPADLSAVVAYVASLNGIDGAATAPAASVDRVARIDVARGRDLFYDATRGFGRCSTCHEVAGLGIPIASPIATVPATVAALRSLLTPIVSTVT